MRKKIFIQGYGHSGGTLVGDFLYEFSDLNYLYRTEFDFSRSPGGLYEIGELIENSGLYVKDSLARRAVKLFNFFANDDRQLDYYGLGLKEVCENFLDKLIFFKAESDDRYFGYTEKLKFPKLKEYGGFIKFLRVFLKKYVDKYNNDIKKINNDTGTYYLNLLTKKEYIEIASHFLEDLFHLLPDNTTVLHHPLSIIEDKVDYQLEYWKDYKALIVDKDPRDIYCAMHKDFSKYEYLKIYDTPEKFIAQFKQKRKYHKHNLELLGTNGQEFRCEDFIFNYDETRAKLIDYFELDPKKHVNKFRYFDPEISAKNVGLYKNFSDQKAISKIEKELFDYITPPPPEKRRDLIKNVIIFPNTSAMESVAA